MGGTLTKELERWRWCQYLPAAAGPSLGGWVVVVWWWNLTAGRFGFVEHTVGSSGHRPRWVVVPGTGRSVDHEPLARSTAAGPLGGLVGAGGG